MRMIFNFLVFPVLLMGSILNNSNIFLQRMSKFQAKKKKKKQTQNKKQIRSKKNKRKNNYIFTVNAIVTQYTNSLTDLFLPTRINSFYLCTVK